MTADSHLSPGLVRVLLIAVAVVTAIATHAVQTGGLFNPRTLTAPEMIETIRWLDGYYSSEDGLRRPTGMVIDGHVDYEAIAYWLFQNYLQARAAGATPEEARQAIATAIQDTPEWRQKHGR